MIRLESENYNAIAGWLFGLFAAVTFFLSRAHIGPFGLPVILFLILFSLAFHGVLIEKIYSFERRILCSAIVYAAFLVVMAVSFFLTDSVTYKDIHYILSTASNFMWIPFLIVLYSSKERFYNTFLMSFTLTVSVFMIFVWCYGVHLTSDYFYMRTDIPGGFLFSNSVLHNPNVAARTALMLVPLLAFVSFKRNLNYFSRNAVLVLILGLLIVAVATLSRANYIALIMFSVAIVSAFAYLERRAKYINWYKGVLVTIFATLIVALLSSTVRERVFSLKKLENKTMIALSSSGREQDIMADSNDITHMSNTDVTMREIATDKQRDLISSEGVKDIVVLDGHFNDINVDILMMPKRVRTWLASLLIVRDNYLTGVGFSNALSEQRKYGAVTYYRDDLNRKIMRGTIAVHGGFLKIAVYAGVPALILFIVFIVVLFEYGISNFRRLGYGTEGKSAAFMLVLYAAMLIPMNIAADSFGMPLTWFIFAALIAAIHNGRRNELKQI